MHRDSKRRQGSTAFLCVAMILVLMGGCGEAPRKSGSPIVAVWTLENLSIGASQVLGLEEILSNEILDAFRKAPHYRAIERERLLAVIEELHLGSSQLADETTRLRLGRILGAQNMVFGSIQVVGSRMRLDLRLVDVASSRVLRVSTKTVDSTRLTDWLSAARVAAQELM